MNALLNAQGLSVTFGGLKAVDGLDISIREGHIHALIGPNGAGKSTVVNALSGFVKPTAGSLTISGSEVCGREAHVIAQAGLARTFQNIRLFGAMSVLETVLVGAHRHFDANLWHLLFLRRALRVHEAQMVEQAKALLRFVGLDESFDERAPTTLAYGHQRRVEIARALISRPRLLLLDEPLAGMNLAEKEELSALIKRIRDDGTSVLLVEHDMSIIHGLADRITVLYHEQKLAEGSVTEVFANEAVQSAYFGKQKVKGGKA